MKKIQITPSINWFHITNPKESDIKELQEVFDIHPVFLGELLRPSSRSKVEVFGDYLYLTYHLPIYNINKRTSQKLELDIVATKDALITVSYEELEPLLKFELDVSKSTKREEKTTAELICEILYEIEDFSFRQLKHIEEKVNKVGENLFKKQGEYKLLEDISYIKRDLLDFSLIAAQQRNALDSFVERGAAFWDESVNVFLSDLHGNFMKIHYLLENLRITIESHSQTVSQIFQFRTSEVVRKFSILGFLTFPLVLYSTISLEPKVASTFIKTPADFWIAFGIVAILVAVLAYIFRKKGWL